MASKSPKYAATQQLQQKTQSGTIHTTNTDRHRNFENNTVVWLDASINSSKDNVRSKAELRSTINYLKTFDDADECIDYILSVRTESVFLIVSGSFGQTLLPLVHDLKQIEFIYIFCSNKQWHLEWASHFSKVHGVHTDMKHICEALRKDVRTCSNDTMIPMSVMPSSLSNTNNNRQEASFMYSQLLIEILFEVDITDTSKQDMIDECRMQYEHNEAELRHIDEFDKNYQKHQAIWWYTRECFLYRMLNKALRVQDTDILFKFRFFIKDLHDQLTTLHSKSNHRESTLTLYRGQGITTEEFEKMKQGAFVSMNNFLSTSTNRAVAVQFAQQSMNRHDVISVLFEMDIKVDKCISPFAAIEELSAVKTENEILFSIGTVFRIESVEKQDFTNIWDLKLALTGEEDKELKTLTDQLRQEVRSERKLDSLGLLLQKMGKYVEAEQYYLVLLNETSPEDPYIATIHNNIAVVYKNMGDYSKALTYYEQTLELELKTLGPNHPSMATTYNNIGGIYNDMGDYSKALTYYEQTLELQLKTLGPNHPSVATTYNNIGKVYNDMGDYAKALTYYEQTLELQLKTLGPNHPDVARTYNNIGVVYSDMGDYSKALTYYEQTLELQLKTLGSNHPSVATTYNNKGKVYNNMGDYSKALTYYEQTLELQLKTLGPNHPDVARTYNSMGMVYNDMGDYSKALTCFKRALEDAQKSLPSFHPDIDKYIRTVCEMNDKLITHF
ncbi:unnamed protein product [Didymodactylos carnosus]|uniref:Multifunctional fusion protein n=2 Tax=Didymodactylos carnosus TaxID=1234261 RepID=A0A814VTM5_9BILA|nr:unnamed protein product [Didymodactylos carnosus]CAF3956572.1 unnamed protein product [Didymodactylos carnosus]